MFRIISPLILFTIFINFLLLGCKKTENNKPANQNSFTDNFTTGTDSWVGDFTDYPNDPLSLPDYQLVFTHTTLPLPLNTADGALMQSGINRSDDLFMFIKKKVTGLVAGKSYSVDMKIDFATNAGSNMVGVGGAPGEGVTIKAGAASVEQIGRAHV